MLADGLGFAAPLGALARRGRVRRCWSSRSRGRERLGPDVATALGLAGMLALGVILASDVFESGPGVESLLFGSLLLVEPRDLAIAPRRARRAAVAPPDVCGRAWLASGFDPGDGRLARRAQRGRSTRCCWRSSRSS